jgi:hypothetical protein
MSFPRLSLTRSKNPKVDHLTFSLKQIRPHDQLTHIPNTNGSTKTLFRLMNYPKLWDISLPTRLKLQFHTPQLFGSRVHATDSQLTMRQPRARAHNFYSFARDPAAP